ncbi:hypothetical protein [Mesorhizobium sp. ESP-6-4]|uniref:hypothetical protein n=1 Tax=unclassified Mesorhizobium TaxID=325217 RepID=UPI00398CE53C
MRECEKWLSDLHELDRIADSAIRLVREEVNQDAVELDRLIRDIETEMTALRRARPAPPRAAQPDCQRCHNPGSSGRPLVLATNLQSR